MTLRKATKRTGLPVCYYYASAAYLGCLACSSYMRDDFIFGRLLRNKRLHLVLGEANGSCLVVEVVNGWHLDGLSCLGNAGRRTKHTKTVRLQADTRCNCIVYFFVFGIQKRLLEAYSNP